MKYEIYIQGNEIEMLLRIVKMRCKIEYSMRDKPHAIAQTNRKYKAHLERLEQISAKGCQSIRESARMQALLSNSHRIHELSMNYLFQQRHKVESPQAHMVESVLKRQRVGDALQAFAVPSKSGAEGRQRELMRVNKILVDRLLNVKSPLAFHPIPPLAKHSPIKDNNHCSRMYNNSTLNQPPPQTILIKVGRQKHAVKFVFKLSSCKALRQFIRDQQSFFIVQVTNSHLTKTTNPILLPHILENQIILKVQSSLFCLPTLIAFNEIVNEKELLRFCFPIPTIASTSWQQPLCNAKYQQIDQILFTAHVKHKINFKESFQNSIINTQPKFMSLNSKTERIPFVRNTIKQNQTQRKLFF